MLEYLVFDLETQRSAQDVGGWDHIPEMKMSVGVLYDSRDGKFHSYFESDVVALMDHLRSGPLVIGYNHMGFDYPVLSGYYPLEERAEALQGFKDLKNLDLLLDLRDRIGKRVKLDAVVRPTLEVGKSADGLMALEWYKEYLDGQTEKLGMIADYCKQDVAVTRDLFEYGRKTGEVKYLDRDRGILEVGVVWGEEPKADDPEPDQSEQLSFF
ncbi:MAG: ribonuclease H-like domain-containing protein [bacterium]|nr:ribonuclease H-like domain-containing protein [bacterium]